MANPPRVQVEHGTKTGIQANQQENKRIKSYDNAHQTRDAEKTKAPFEFVEHRHRSPTVAQQSVTSIPSLHEKARRTLSHRT